MKPYNNNEYKPYNNNEGVPEKKKYDKELFIKTKTVSVHELKESLDKYNTDSFTNDIKDDYSKILALTLGKISCELCGGKGHKFFHCPAKFILDKTIGTMDTLKDYWGYIKVKAYHDMEVEALKKANK